MDPEQIDQQIVPQVSLVHAQRPIESASAQPSAQEQYVNHPEAVRSARFGHPATVVAID
jgi:hypothetical protein